ncbi:MAG: hypothetical protein HY700_02415 [Gemmatimonadetes bacterium]|nr:hypothetical protein [Gemmatimonadota bacterium]
MRTSVLTALALVLPALVQAQQGIALRFHPAVGARLQFVSETRLNTVVVGFPSLPDSTAIESTWRTVTTQRVVEVRGAEPVVSETFDSSRARARIGTTPRADVLIPGVAGLSGRWLVTDKLDIVALTGGRGGDSAYLDVLTSTQGGLALTFPENAVAGGQEWTTRFRFPLGAHLAATGKVAAYGSIMGRATVVVDSLVPRATDTLVYLTARAVADPTPLPLMAEGGTGTGTFSGGFAAALVWSTGWNAVVSAATNGRVTGTLRVDREDGPPVNGALSITISGRQQVRL